MERRKKGGRKQGDKSVKIYFGPCLSQNYLIEFVENKTPSRLTSFFRKDGMTITISYDYDSKKLTSLFVLSHELNTLTFPHPQH